MDLSLSKLEYIQCPQSLLLVLNGSDDAESLLKPLLTRMLCDGTQKPCGHCKQCHHLASHTHPDVTIVKPEKEGAAIKVDQVRALQQSIYTTPLCASKRIVLITAAHKLNEAASNALLKSIEEPPQNTYFILTTTSMRQISTTLASRCVKFSLAQDELSPRVLDVEVLFRSCMEGIKQRQASVCEAVKRFADFPLDDVLSAIQLYIHKEIKSNSHTMRFFKQLDMLIDIKKKVSENIPLNATLLLESIFIGFVC